MAPVAKETTFQCKRLGFDPWTGKMPWKRKWQPTLVFLPGKSHGKRTLAGYSPWDYRRVGHHLATKQQYLWNVCCCVSGTVLKALSKLTQSLKPYDEVTIVSSIFTDWDTETKMSSDLSKQTFWRELGFEPMWSRHQPLCWRAFVRMQPLCLVSALHTSFNSHSNSCKWAI